MTARHFETVNADSADIVTCIDGEGPTLVVLPSLRPGRAGRILTVSPTGSLRPAGGCCARSRAASPVRPGQCREPI